MTVSTFSFVPPIFKFSDTARFALVHICDEQNDEIIRALSSSRRLTSLTTMNAWIQAVIIRQFLASLRMDGMHLKVISSYSDRCLNRCAVCLAASETTPSTMMAEVSVE